MSLKNAIIFKNDVTDETLSIIKNFIGIYKLEFKNNVVIIEKEIEKSILLSLYNMLEFELGLNLNIVCYRDFKYIDDFLYLKKIGIIDTDIIYIDEYLFEYAIYKASDYQKMIEELQIEIELKQDDIDFIVDFYRLQTNIAKISRKRYMHRNSVLYHIERINKLTGLNIKKFNDIQKLYLYIILNKMNLFQNL